MMLRFVKISQIKYDNISNFPPDFYKKILKNVCIFQIK